jgi:hypothetical protein
LGGGPVSVTWSERLIAGENVKASGEERVWLFLLAPPSTIDDRGVVFRSGVACRQAAT